MPLNPRIAESHVADRQIVYEADAVLVASKQYPAMALIGRLLLAAIFLMSGIEKLTDLPGTAAQLAGAGIPYADLLARVAGIAEVAGAIAIAVGLLARVGAAGLLLFMIAATLVFHAFWRASGPEHVQQMIHFMKNLAIMGGLATVVAHGAGWYSIDGAVRRSRLRRQVGLRRNID
jgi:putative oxidoreductase